jgi:hypothetical protein
MGKIDGRGVVSERPDPKPGLAASPGPGDPDPADVAELEPVTAEPPRPPPRHAPAG